MSLPVSASQAFAKSGLDQMTKRELLRFIQAQTNALQAICAKLDADAGVSDTDYSATLAAHIKD